MRASLATKFTFLIFSIALLGFLSGLAALLFTWLTAHCLRSAVTKDLPSVQAAAELGGTVLDQKGLLSGYILPDGTPILIEKYHKAEAAFATCLPRARATAHTREEIVLLDELEVAYADYDSKCKKCIVQFNKRQREEATSTLVHEVWPAYDLVDKLCGDFIRANEDNSKTNVTRAERYVAVATWGVLIGSLGSACLAGLLSWQVVRRFLIPLRRMVTEARDVMGHIPDSTTGPADDELRSIGAYFRALMADVVEKRTTLEENRSHLLNMEKLASLGKLAASVAHEMRNPLSSMKMWLYSIRKTAQMEPSLDHKCQILSDEISRLEGIVRNVLEFSRPFALKLRPSSLPEVIDKTLEVLRPSLEARNIRVMQHHAEGLPCAIADCAQLQQVFANLLDNAVAAMPEGGEISISSATEVSPDGKAMVVVRIKDAGPGIPDDVRSRLFEPFFTTKEQGIGLGLCIAANIMAQHDGQLVLESTTSGGSTFTVRLLAGGEKTHE